MKNITVKFVAIAAILLPVFLILAARPDISNAAPLADDDTAAVYKAKCAMCHSPKAEKSFDPEMTDEEMVKAILDGKKAAKPPHMPAYRDKGIDEAKAAALVKFMRELRTPPSE
ncbi:MAG: cytochrome c [Acidobacteria bacterium]|nr:cytochrome c [Acidobacteriota bacterium]